MSNIVFGKKFRFFVNSSLGEYKNFSQVIAGFDFELVNSFQDVRRSSNDLGDKSGILEINFYQAFLIENINSPLCDKLPPPKSPATYGPSVHEILLAPKLKEQCCVYRSQRCCVCGLVRESQRKGKKYSCQCGHASDADLNASLNHECELPAVDHLRHLGHNIDGFYWKPEGIFDLNGNELTVRCTNKDTCLV